MKISVGNTQYPGEIEQFAFLKEGALTAAISPLDITF